MVKTFEIVGMRHRGKEAVAVVARLRAGDEVTLIREPQNRFDSNAVQVLVSGVHVGYVKALDAPPIARVMDARQMQSAIAHMRSSAHATFSIEDHAQQVSS